MKCGKQIGAPSYHGQQRSVSQLGAEWIEDKAEGKGGRSLLKGWGASGAGVWRMRDACSPELGRVQQPSAPLCPASFYLPQWWWRPQAALRAAAAVTADASCWLQEDGRAERRTELFSE